MWCTGEKCCRDRDDRLWSLFILTTVNASVDCGGGGGTYWWSRELAFTAFHRVHS